MGDNNLMIARVGLPKPPSVDGDCSLDPPAFAEKKRLQQQDMQVLLDKTPLFEQPLAISTKASSQELALGWNPFAVVSARPAAHPPTGVATPAPPDPTLYTDDALRHDIAATRLQLGALGPSGPQRPALEQRLEQLQSEGDKRWGNYDACEDAGPTLVPASRLPAHPLAPADLLSCSQKGGACASVEQVAALETERQKLCASTGVDPTRFADMATGVPAAGVDKQAAASANVAKWMEVIDAQTQNPLAAAVAASSIARGESVDGTVARVHLANAIAGLAASLAATGQKTPHLDTTEPTRVERTLDVPAPGELTAAERGDIRAFLGRNKIADQYVAETMLGMEAGTRAVRLDRDLTVYRNFGGMARANGRWVVAEMPVNPRKDLALPPGNTCEGVSKWVIPKGTEVLFGPAARLNGLPGGAQQIYVPDPTVMRGPLP